MRGCVDREAVRHPDADAVDELEEDGVAGAERPVGVHRSGGRGRVVGDVALLGVVHLLGDTPGRRTRMPRTRRRAAQATARVAATISSERTLTPRGAPRSDEVTGDAPWRADPLPRFPRRLRRRLVSPVPSSSSAANPQSTAATTGECRARNTTPPCGMCTHSAPTSAERVGRVGSTKLLWSPLKTYRSP